MSCVNSRNSLKLAKEEHSKAAKAVEKLGGEVFHTEDGLSYTTAVQKAQERKRKVKPLLDEETNWQIKNSD